MVVVGSVNRTTNVGNSWGCLFAMGILVGDFLSWDGLRVGGINFKDNQESYRQ